MASEEARIQMEKGSSGGARCSDESVIGIDPPGPEIECCRFGAAGDGADACSKLVMIIILGPIQKAKKKGRP
jgi:hypothetical protein